MNFLAHAVLAGNAPDRIAGSMAGDFVKGVLYDADYPAEFLLGLRLHRRIDAFSNRQVHLRQSAGRLPEQLRRMAPPCIDMLADHFLADAAIKDPEAYLSAIAGKPDSADTLTHYENALHQILAPHLGRLSPEAKRFFDHAHRTHLFSSYQTFERTARGIHYVCERLGSADQGPAMVDALEGRLEVLRNDFDHYWPALKAEASRYLAQDD